MESRRSAMPSGRRRDGRGRLVGDHARTHGRASVPPPLRRPGAAAAPRPGTRCPRAQSRSARARRPSAACSRVGPRARVGEHQPGDPLPCHAPQLERDVSTHRQPADDHALDARARRAAWRHPSAAAPIEHRRSGAVGRLRTRAATVRRRATAVAARSELLVPHPGIQRERVDQQHAIGGLGHRDPLRVGPDHDRQGCRHHLEARPAADRPARRRRRPGSRRFASIAHARRASSSAPSDGSRARPRTPSGTRGGTRPSRGPPRCSTSSTPSTIEASGRTFMPPPNEMPAADDHEHRVERERLAVDRQRRSGPA